MGIETLIKRLNQYSQSLIAYKLGADFADVCMNAATALSTLRAENEKLRGELEQASWERDAAVKDLNEFLSLDELCSIQCKWCKWENTNCDGKIPEWRGPQKED